MNVLLLYDPNATFTGTVREHLESFHNYSRNRIFYAPATLDAKCLYNLAHFEAILIHYSVRLCYEWHISPRFAEALRDSKAHKLLFIQDEYDHTAMARKWMRELGINSVYTCVPEQYVRDVYPESEVPGVRFVQTLTGWVSTESEAIKEWRSLKDRENWINYRGRNLPAWYGDLGREKLIIGERMRQECEQRGIPCDIEWTEETRIYGDAWPRFLQGARTALGSESGANVFDDDGRIRAGIEDDLKDDPQLSYEELHRRHIGQEEGRVKMNQVSPRIFEAAALGTGLVLFRGGYSGVVRPDEHYIPLEKDFSNVDEVFERLEDLDGLEDMARRCRADVIESGKYSYRAFIEGVDCYLDEVVGNTSESLPFLKIFEHLQEVSDPTLKEAFALAWDGARAGIEIRWKAVRANPREMLWRHGKRVALAPAKLVFRLGRRGVRWIKHRGQVLFGSSSKQN